MAQKVTGIIKLQINAAKATASPPVGPALANVRTPDIQVEGGKEYGTKEVGEWIVNYINNK